MKIIKIGSSWCPGCIVMKPIWERIEKEVNINTEYYDYDIYEDILKEKYNIKDKLPIIIFFDKNNNEIDRKNGKIKYNDLLNKIMEYKNLWKNI